MYRLLIVDDEEIITDSLYETFARYMPDSLDVCKAYSAAEALSWMRRSRIDIVLTDIRMPGTSGLELTEEIQARWPQCRVIFLTGHSDFDYAYKAFQMGNVRYLLKTEGYDKVMTVVEQVIEEIRQSHTMNEVLEQSDEITSRLAALQQEEYVRKLLQQCKPAGSADEIQAELTRRNIELQADSPVFLVLGRFNTMPVNPADLEHVQASIRVIGSSLIREHAMSASVTDHYGDAVWLIQPNRENVSGDDHFVTYVEGTLELVQEACQSSLGVSIAFALSGQGCPWSQIPRQYERLRLLQWMKIGDGVSMVLTDRTEEPAVGASKDYIRISSRIELMIGYLETGRFQAFYDVFEEQINELLQQDMIMERAMETYYHLALMLYTTFNRWGLPHEIPDQRRLLHLGDYRSIREAVHNLYQAADQLVQFKQANEAERANLVTQTISTYIKNNLEKDLSLVRLAEMNHFNPSYLSRFFKQETGINLSEFIDDCRIRRAKELLAHTDLMVREIALQVGYEAAHSFTRLFKKLTGMTPQEYRESLLVR